MAVLAVDVGGTLIKLAVVENGVVFAKSSLDAQSDGELRARLPIIASRLIELLPSSATVEGVGMAFPSLIDGNRVVGDVGKFRDAETLDLAGWARESFGAPFAIENDARMATIGEWKYGIAKGASDVVMVTLGTGIGTGVISGGSVLRGRHGSAGILGGHMTAHIGGDPCPCGNIGCWETEASTAVLPVLAARLGLACHSERPALPGFGEPDGQAARSDKSHDSHQVPPLRPDKVGPSVGMTRVDLNYKSVFEMAAEGDPGAVRVRDRSVEVWGALAVSLIHAYDPEILVFGGGVMASGDIVLSNIRETVNRYAWMPMGRVRIEASVLGDEAQLLACEWLVRNQTEGGNASAS